MSHINQKLSIIIPRVFPQWIDEQIIADVFEKQHIGKVYKVSIVRMLDDTGHNYPIYKAFVYFSWWYENEIVYNLQQKIYGSKKQARVVYDDPWYWVLFENKQPRLSLWDRRMMRVDSQTQWHLNQLYLQAQPTGPQPTGGSHLGHDDTSAYTWPDTWSNLLNNDTWAGQEASRSEASRSEASRSEPKQSEPKQSEPKQSEPPKQYNKLLYNKHIKGQPCEYTCEECHIEEQAEWAKQAEAAGQPYIFYDGVPRQEPWM